MMACPGACTAGVIHQSIHQSINPSINPSINRSIPGVATLRHVIWGDFHHDHQNAIKSPSSSFCPSRFVPRSASFSSFSCPATRPARRGRRCCRAGDISSERRNRGRFEDMYVTVWTGGRGKAHICMPCTATTTATLDLSLNSRVWVDRMGDGHRRYARTSPRHHPCSAAMGFQISSSSVTLSSIERVWIV
ncbi:uncharacterized protein K489DRAFT_246862 [Dissoconium aciculare CBS 342.82]|uniref:Uncharacterized protein n=1 Tax=Dissoconium aciculare CBS 342.82 TaxID=1314786 RepID=A0A6J3M009_9PEZI|nr:uncharacterized protein K489DRAFT_246862 [Dissoconium aciculare CBS 342.82]KAF1821365.1 hypothetical protein K489DRAFT_246862 [Dissoconium aciculare CBS 342.82]